MQDLFADRFINLKFHRGIICFDFARLKKLDPEQQRATFSPSQRVVMPVDALAGCCTWLLRPPSTSTAHNIFC